jgi:hypothetical protein
MLDSLRRVAGRELEMKMALVGMTGMEPSLLAWQVALDRAGTPYDVLALAHRRERATLISGLRRTGFQALILAGADVLESALSAGQRAVLSLDCFSRRRFNYCWRSHRPGSSRYQ